MKPQAKIILRPGREKVLKRRHPWIFSGAIRDVAGNPDPGETVAVESDHGAVLAWAAWSPHSQIRARIWSFNPEEKINADFFRKRLSRAVEHRKRMNLEAYTDAWRIINAESDGLPGLIADHYASFIVVQFLSAGADHWKVPIVNALEELFPSHSIYERSDAPGRSREGLPFSTGILTGEDPGNQVEIREYDNRFYVDVIRGHKTGFYLDQRENRQALTRYVHDKRVLNAFSYTGGFGIAAARKGAASVTHIDSSSEALDLAKRHLDLNDLSQENHELVQGNVFEILRNYREKNRSFDVIILDPPKFVESKAHMGRGTRGYKDVNMLACQLLEPGGVLATFSCSGQVERELFQKIVADAALDAGREIQVMEWLSQASDHAVDLAFPEGLYLKGLIGRVW